MSRDVVPPASAEPKKIVRKAIGPKLRILFNVVIAGVVAAEPRADQFAALTVASVFPAAFTALTLLNGKRGRNSVSGGSENRGWSQLGGGLVWLVSCKVCRPLRAMVAATWLAVRPLPRTMQS